MQERTASLNDVDHRRYVAVGVVAVVAATGADVWGSGAPVLPGWGLTAQARPVGGRDPRA